MRSGMRLLTAGLFAAVCPALGAAARSGRLLPRAVGFLDRLVRAELFVERSLSRTPRGPA